MPVALSRGANNSGSFDATTRRPLCDQTRFSSLVRLRPCRMAAWVQRLKPHDQPPHAAVHSAAGIAFTDAGASRTSLTCYERADDPPHLDPPSRSSLWSLSGSKFHSTTKDLQTQPCYPKRQWRKPLPGAEVLHLTMRESSTRSRLTLRRSMLYVGGALTCAVNPSRPKPKQSLQTNTTQALLVKSSCKFNFTHFYSRGFNATG